MYLLHVIVVLSFSRITSLTRVLVCLFTELQQSVNNEEEWVMTMAAHLTNYRDLARLEQLMREKGKLTIECC